MKYGARHLKRAFDRALVEPLSNLIATGQVRGGDSIWVDFNPGARLPNVLIGTGGRGDIPADGKWPISQTRSAGFSGGGVARRRVELTRAARPLGRR